jgi:uncharacterized protein YbjQ (UPF0145 family)
MNWVVTCTKCGSSYVYESGQGLPEMCSICAEKRKKEVKKFLEKEQKRKEILMVSTSGITDRKIVKTLGIVSHQQIFGMSLLRDLNFEKFNGGISLSWTEKVNNGREMSLQAIRDEAIELGGNAIVGVDVFDQVLGVHNDIIMMLVGVKGTAVVVN